MKLIMQKIKRIIFISIFLLISLMYTNKVEASTATFSLKPSASTVVVGNDVSVTVTLSSSVAIMGWDFVVMYDTNYLKLVSSPDNSQRVVGYSDGKQKSISYKFTFKALKSGNTSVYIADHPDIVDFDEQQMSISKGSAKLTLKTWAQIEAGYSKNADLKNITIDGGELNPEVKLNPEFSKDTLEYTVELEPDTTEVTVNAIKADSTASVSGTGKIQVSEGSNKIEIVVTAQKGNTKTYVINAIVKELEPINVTVDGNEYTVIRKVENMVKPYSYTEDTVMIHELEVPAFYSSITGYKLVGLKDETGIVKLFVYDEVNDTYKYYQELSLNKVILAPVSIPDNKIIQGYVKDKITINNEEVECIKHEEFGTTLVYGKNIENGKTMFYVYDKEENTLQRYDEDSFAKINKKFELYTYIILGAGGFIVLLIIILITNMVKNKKKLKIRKEEMKNSLQIEAKEEMAILETPSKKEIKKRNKELKRKQKELEELERQAQKKLQEQERLKAKEEKKNRKKDKKKLKEESLQQAEQFEPKKEENMKLQEFELETKNEAASKKKKKNKKSDEDDDMFLL